MQEVTVNEGLTPEQDAAQKTADAASIAAADANDAINAGQPAPAAAPATDTKTRPDHIPEKFWNAEKGEVDVEGLAKSYTTLESAHDKQEPTPDTTKDVGDTTKEVGNELFAKASAEYAQGQQLSDATYGELEKAGISRDMVSQYIAGAEAKNNSLREAAFAPVGGEENYGKMLVWANENISEAAQKAFDLQIDSGDPEVIKTAVEGLATQYKANAGSEGDLIGGDNTPSTSGTFFRSKAEMVAAQADPRYKTDANFRNEVAQKIGRAEQNGINLFV